MAPTRTRNLEQPEEDIELLDEQDELEEEEEELEEAVSRRRGRKSDDGESKKSKERRPRQKQSRTDATGIDRIPVLRSLVAYFRGVVSELQKVTWPSREETTRLTMVVLAVTVAFAIGLGALDYFLGWWFKQAVGESTELTFLLVGAGIAVAIGGGFALLRREI